MSDAPFGMKYPLYSSSSLTRRGIAKTLYERKLPVTVLVHILRTERSNWMPSVDLFDQSVDIWHRAEIFERRQTMRAQHCLELAPCARLDVVVETHREEERVHDSGDL